MHRVRRPGCTGLLVRELPPHRVLWSASGVLISRLRPAGQRTTFRVWGDQKMPDLSDKWTRVNETIVMYCGPRVELVDCWRHRLAESGLSAAW